MVTPVSITHQFNGDTAAADMVDAALLDTNLGNVAATLNAEIAERQRTVRDGGGLANQSVRFPALHPEIITALSGITFLQDVAVATTANITLAGLQTIDGYTLLSNDRILVNAQTNQIENGIYTAVAGSWTRTADATGALAATAAVGVVNGTSYAGSVWRLSAAATLGTTANTWIPIQAFGSVIPVTRGGTGATTAPAARTNLGLGSLSTLSAVTQAQLAVDVQYQVDNIVALKALTTTYATVLVRGYYAAGDGGGGLFIWNSTDVTVDNLGTVIIPNSAPATGRWNRILATAIDVRMFGAKGDGTTDDATAINAALALKYPVRFPLGTYLIGTTLLMDRGNVLFGDGSFEDTTGKTVTIKLKAAANCVMVKTPNAATGAAATHYMGIKNIVFDGNGANQTVKFDGVQFWGVFVGSFLQNVLIKNVFGRGLTMKNSFDLSIDMLWVTGCQTADYGVTFDSNDVSNIVGIVNIGSLYVENNAINAGAWNAALDPRNVAADRATAIYIYRVLNFCAAQIHVEGAAVGINLEFADVVSIAQLGCTWMGSAVADANCAVRIKTVPRCLTIQSARIYGNNPGSLPFLAGFRMVALASGTASGNVVRQTDATVSGIITCNGYYIRGAFATTDRSDFALPADAIAQNKMHVVQLGAASDAGLSMHATETDLTKYTDIRITGLGISFVTNVNEASEISFAKILSYGNAGRAWQFDQPMTLTTRAIETSTPAGTMYLDSGTNNRPLLKLATTDPRVINTMTSGAVAPTANALYIGAMYLDTVLKKLYVATGVGGGAADWTILN